MEVAGGIEERMLILDLGSVEYTVGYVSSAGLYFATSDLGQVFTSFSEGVVDEY